VSRNLKKIALGGIALIVSLTVLFASDAFALKKKKRLKMVKSRSFRSSQSYTPDSSMLGMQEILSDTVDANFLDNPDERNFDIYNNQGIRGWRSETFWNDSEEERAAQRTWAVGASTSVMQALRESEFRNQIVALESGVREFMGLLSYSVKDTGRGYTLSRKGNGSEILTLSLQLSLSRGADPQISISDSCRLRYDWARARTLVEFGFDF
jgi:hypothetical protein